ADAEAVLHARPVVLDQHVGALGHLDEDVAPFGLFQVELEAPLVAMEVLEVRAVARAGDAVLRPFDLDDVGAPVGEDAAAVRAGARPREVDDLEVGEGEHGSGNLPYSPSSRPPSASSSCAF